MFAVYARVSGFLVSMTCSISYFYPVVKPYDIKIVQYWGDREVEKTDELNDLGYAYFKAFG